MMEKIKRKVKIDGITFSAIWYHSQRLKEDSLYIRIAYNQKNTKVKSIYGHFITEEQIKKEWTELQVNLKAGLKIGLEGSDLLNHCTRVHTIDKRIRRLNSNIKEYEKQRMKCLKELCFLEGYKSKYL